MCRGHDFCKAVEALRDVIGIQKQRRWRQQRAFDIVPPLFVALGQILPELVDVGPERLRQDEQRVLRQIIKNRFELVEKERQVIFDASGHQTVADVFVDLADQRITGDLFAVALAKLSYRIGVGRKFACGQQFDAVGSLQRALVGRIETSDRFDFIIEQIDAVGQAAASRVEVDDRSSDRELTVLHHLRYIRIAAGLEPASERVDFESVTDFQQQHMLLDIAAWRQFLQQGVDRQDQDVTGLSVGQRVQGFQTVGNNVLMRREYVVGQGLPIRQMQQRVATTTVEADLVVQLAGVGQIIDHQHHRAGSVATRGLDSGQRQRTAVQTAPVHRFGAR